MTRTSTRALWAVSLLAPLLGGSLPRAAAQVPYPPGTILTIAGAGYVGFSGDGGPATRAKLNSPLHLVVDPAGNLFFCDSINQRVRRVDAAGIITTVAGGGHPADGLGDGGLATEASLIYPVGLALDQTGNLY